MHMIFGLLTAVIENVEGDLNGKNPVPARLWPRLCKFFDPSRIRTVGASFFVTMYYFQPCRLAKSNMPKQNFCHLANVICDGSLYRILLTGKSAERYNRGKHDRLTAARMETESRNPGSKGIVDNTCLESWGRS